MSLSAADKGYLNHLRFQSMSCRTKPRANLFEACALLQVSRDASREAHAEALMRCLSEALGQPARLHAPGSVELTFDEMWLLQLGRSLVQDDGASVSFLLERRVRREHQRLVRFLVGRIAECFALN
ncbi:hypothetical protein [Tateyamaria sp. SN6-1]|uniref:hypothetical protein n=1 Tax=Tateyamaria sp. SN6-1 TaxID=3092148 RepID=UPI0039F5A91D